MSRLRALIESNADDPPRIMTIRGIGYRYDTPTDAGASTLSEDI